MTGIVWGGTWRLRATYVDYSFLCALVGVRIYTCPYMCTQLKIHDIKSLVFLVPEVSLAQFYFLFDGPGMSFVEGIVCPQASQTCCDRYSISAFKFSMFSDLYISMGRFLLLCFFLPAKQKLFVQAHVRIVSFFPVSEIPLPLIYFNTTFSAHIGQNYPLFR